MLFLRLPLLSLLPPTPHTHPFCCLQAVAYSKILLLGQQICWLLQSREQGSCTLPGPLPIATAWSPSSLVLQQPLAALSSLRKLPGTWLSGSCQAGWKLGGRCLVCVETQNQLQVAKDLGHSFLEIPWHRTNLFKPCLKVEGVCICLFKVTLCLIIIVLFIT